MRFVIVLFSFVFLSSLLSVSEAQDSNAIKEIQKWNAVLQKQPKNRLVFNRLVQIYKEQGDLASVEKTFARMSEQWPKNAFIYLEWGNSLFDLQDYAKAIEKYNLSIEMNSTKGIVYYNRGAAYARLNNFQEAVKSFEKALSIVPDKEQWKVQLAYAYEQIQDSDKAINIYKESKGNKNQDRISLLRYNKAVSLYKEDKLPEAINAFNEVLKEDSTNVDALYGLSLVYYKQFELDSVQGLLEKCILLDPNFSKAYYNLAASYISSEDYEKAMTHYISYLNIQAGDESTYKTCDNILDLLKEINTNSYNTYKKEFAHVIRLAENSSIAVTKTFKDLKKKYK